MEPKKMNPGPSEPPNVIDIAPGGIATIVDPADWFPLTLKWRQVGDKVELLDFPNEQYVPAPLASLHLSISDGPYRARYVRVGSSFAPL